MGPFETDRLYLRRFHRDDWPAIYRLIYSDRDVYGMYSSLGGDEPAARERFEHVVHQPTNGDFGRLAVLLKGSLTLIGQVHFDPHVTDDGEAFGDGSSPFNTIDVELAFAFGKAYWGHGYALEACQRMVDYAFGKLKLSRLVGGVMEENERSISLHRRLGYRFVKNPNRKDPVGLIAVLENPGESSPP